MSGYVRWQDIRDELIERTGGEEAAEERVQRLLLTTVGYRLAEIRETRRLSRQHVADRMGVSEDRVFRIEQGEIESQEVIDKYAEALGGGLNQSIDFDNGDSYQIF
jgi:ribosome-binding protein aMBF1 (putative translation factor)